LDASGNAGWIVMIRAHHYHNHESDQNSGAEYVRDTLLKALREKDDIQLTDVDDKGKPVLVSTKQLGIDLPVIVNTSTKWNMVTIVDPNVAGAAQPAMLDLGEREQAAAAVQRLIGGGEAGPGEQRGLDAVERRLADLRAATSVEDLPVAKPRKNSGTCVVDLPQGYRLVFVPNHTKNPMLKPRTVDWARVGRIKILRIENTDGR